MRCNAITYLFSKDYIEYISTYGSAKGCQPITRHGKCKIKIIVKNNFAVQIVDNSKSYYNKLRLIRGE